MKDIHIHIFISQRIFIFPLQMSHFNFVEAKLLSHERSKPAPSSTPHSPTHQEPVLFGAGEIRR